MFARYFARLDNVARLRSRIAREALALERRRRELTRDEWATLGTVARRELRTQLIRLEVAR